MAVKLTADKHDRLARAGTGNPDDYVWCEQRLRLNPREP